MSVAEVEFPLAPARPAGVSREAIAAGGLHALCRPIRHDTDLSPLIGGLYGNPFQSLPVLASWFASFSGRGEARECFLLSLADRNGQPVFALPIIRRRTRGLTRIELPHSGVIDFTTPFLPAGGGEALPPPSVLWSLLRPALPKADVLVFRRMEKGSPGRENPLYALAQTQASRFVTWRVSPLLPHAERHGALAKPYRKKLRRNREKLLELPGARLVVARDATEALPLLERMEAMQGQRIRAKGLDYGLDCPRVKDFYRRLIEEGTGEGRTLLTALMLGEEMLSAGLAIVSGDQAVYLRVASDFDRHAALTPGLIVTDVAMDEAQARGVRHFDFGMGDYHFKRQLGGQANPLRDLIVPLSPRGRPSALAMRARQWASVHPLVRRLFGREALPVPGA